MVSWQICAMAPATVLLQATWLWLVMVMPREWSRSTTAAWKIPRVRWFSPKIMVMWHLHWVWGFRRLPCLIILISPPGTPRETCGFSWLIGNVGYYDSMLRAAYNRCASGSCVIITNPVGHRTQSRWSRVMVLIWVARVLWSSIMWWSTLVRYLRLP